MYVVTAWRFLNTTIVYQCSLIFGTLHVKFLVRTQTNISFPRQMLSPSKQILLHYLELAIFIPHVCQSTFVNTDQLVAPIKDKDRSKQCLIGHNARRTCSKSKSSLGEIIRMRRHYILSPYKLCCKSGTAQRAQCLVQQTGVTESTAQYSI